MRIIPHRLRKKHLLLLLPTKCQFHCLPNIIPHLTQLLHHSYCPQTLPELDSTHSYCPQKLPELDSIHAFSRDPCLFLLSVCRTISSLKIIHAQLILHGLTQSLLCQTKLVSVYGFFGCVSQARSVFDHIPHPDYYCWKVMIRWYFLNDSYLELVEFFKLMKQSVKHHDNVISSIMLKACSELRASAEGMSLHGQIVKLGSPDSFVLTGLVDMYSKCGMVGVSRQIFDEITDRNVVLWTSMIVGYVQNDYAKDGLALFNQMRLADAEPNQFTLASLMTACSKLDALHQGMWVHGYMIKKAVELNSFVVTALLDMYMKCGMVGDARMIFGELTSVDLISWTAMIVGYTQRNYPLEALHLFADKQACMVPNSVTLGSVLSACAQLGSLNLGRSVHMLGIKLGLEEDATVKNALVDMYAKCGMLGDASDIFQRILHRDLITWNAMISGYSQNGLSYEALSLFHQMRLSGFLPDAVTVVSSLSGCASLGALQIGSSFHAFAEKNGFLSNVYVGTALINLYAKCGDGLSARSVFDGMREKNLVAWSAMMGAYGLQGESNDSLALFSDMLREDLMPNDAIFTSILSACSHTGMVGEGLKHFEAMSQEYQITPSMKHYACMVDLLARAGRLEDALDFIDRMTVPADTSVWGAFLHGCRLHMRLELGELAIKRMLELQPDSGGYYVLISHLYASDGRWNEASKLRDLMVERGLNKLPGCSFVEMDNIRDPIPNSWQNSPQNLVFPSKIGRLEERTT